MSSNLTITYASPTASGSASAGVAAADATSPDSPLGFFAALIDQLVANVTSGAGKPKDQPDAAGDIGEIEQYDLPPGYALPDAPAPAQPQSGADLLADLTAQLDLLQSQGTPATPDQLRQLDGTLAALGAALAAMPAAVAGGPSDDAAAKLVAGLAGSSTANAAVTEARDKLLALSQSLAATAPALSSQLDALASRIDGIAADPASLAQFTGQQTAADESAAGLIRALLGAAGNPNDDIRQLLASLGVDASDGATVSASTGPVPPALLQLSNQLSQLGTALASASPDLAQKLETLATNIVSSGADPKLLAQLQGAAADPDPAALDRLVQQLLDPKPAPSPLPAAAQIAAKTDIAIPAPLASVPSKSAVAEVKAAQPQTTPVTADSAPDTTPRISTTPVTDRTAEPEPQPKSEAKTETKAAAIIADAGKADAAAANNAASNAPPAQPPLLAGAAAPRALPAAYQPIANPINMGQMAFEMARQVQQGNSRFTLRLDPPELGRVDVKMQVDQQGGVTARLTVERAETLDLFQRDQRSLERALAQAGLDASRTTLEFSLRQNPNGGGQQQQQQQNFAAPRFALGGDNDNAAVPAVTLYRGIASAGGVNIFA